MESKEKKNPGYIMSALSALASAATGNRFQRKVAAHEATMPRKTWLKRKAKLRAQRLARRRNRAA